MKLRYLCKIYLYYKNCLGGLDNSVYVYYYCNTVVKRETKGWQWKEIVKNIFK